MQTKQKKNAKTKKQPKITIRDLKPTKDTKGGLKSAVFQTGLKCY